MSRRRKEDYRFYWCRRDKRRTVLKTKKKACLSLCYSIVFHRSRVMNRFPFVILFPQPQNLGRRNNGRTIRVFFSKVLDHHWFTMASSEMQPGTEQLTEKSSLRSAFSTDLGPPPGGYNPLYRLAAWIESVPKRYIVAFMAFLGFCKCEALSVVTFPQNFKNFWNVIHYPNSDKMEQIAINISKDEPL